MANMELYQCVQEEFRKLLENKGEEKKDLSAHDVAQIKIKIRSSTKRVLSDNEVLTLFKSYLAYRRSRSVEPEKVQAPLL